ncbi:MAG TPA: RDD family protein, partial [Acidiferrobacteraceae bacterium]|nr:RDD family protein [Acidiferrobacteraceae bacterium]
SVGAPLTLPQTLLRFAAATLSWVLFGLGFLWMLLDPERATWHDRVSRTRLRLVAPGFQRVRDSK